MTATIMLAKGYEPNKLRFPVMASEKLDGVPAKIHISINEGIYPPSQLVSKRIIWTVQTRQGKPFPAIHQQVAALAEHLQETGCIGTFVFVAEVTHADHIMPFKDVSGHCRRQEQCDELRLNVFDFYKPTLEGPDLLPFGKRIVLASALVRDMFWCKLVPQILCKDAVELAKALIAIKVMHKDGFIPEGAVIRSCHDKWEEGKRGWGYQKVVDDPTTEVWVTDFEEAISATGEPLGMVGRINAIWYDGGPGTIQGVGPGKMTHPERKLIWQDQDKYVEQWATVKYKRDPSYTALRQPTFQHWRPEHEL